MTMATIGLRIINEQYNVNAIFSLKRYNEQRESEGEGFQIQMLPLSHAGNMAKAKAKAKDII